MEEEIEFPGGPIGPHGRGLGTRKIERVNAGGFTYSPTECGDCGRVGFFHVLLLDAACDSMRGQEG